MKIENSKDLDAAIKQLEERRKLQEQMLSDHFHATVEHFKPGNLIRSAFKGLIDSDDTKSKILKAAGGMGIGVIVKNLVFGSPTSFLGKLAATAVKSKATDTVLHNTDKIGAWGKAIFNNLFKRHHSNGADHH